MALSNPFTFKHLTKYATCRVCGAGVQCCHIDGQHCNGEQFESVEYTCGSVIRYSPNFSRIETTKSCPLSITESNRVIAVDKFVKLVSQLVDSQKHLTVESRKRLKQAIFGHSVLRNIECKENHANS